MEQAQDVDSYDEGEGQVSVIDDVTLQRLWLALEKRTWRALAVVPATSEVAALDVANVLGEVAWHYRGTPALVLDLRDVNLRLIEHHKEEIASHVERGDTVILALSAIKQNPAAVAIARAAHVALLAVKLRASSMRDAAATIEEIGRDMFAGTVLVKKAPIAKLPLLTKPSRDQTTVKMPMRGART